MSVIVFVCGSNRSRSPMAAAYFAHLLQEAGITGITAESAGLQARRQDSVSAEARQVLSSHGLEPLAVGTTLLLPKQIKRADLLICMTDDQEERLLSTFPSARGKVRTLMSFMGGDYPVAEPARGDLTAHENCLKQMIPALERLVEKLS